MKAFTLMMIIVAVIGLLPAIGQEPEANAAPADSLPPGVTAAMEQDFLARYQSALKAAKASKDPSGLKDYNALYAIDPAVPPEGRKAFEDFAVIAIAMDTMGHEPSYSFVSVPAADKAKDKAPLQLAGKMYSSYMPPVAELKITFALPKHLDPSSLNMNGSSRPLCIQNGRLMFIGIKPVPGAVPPPMDNPADNFGLTPNHLKQGDTDDDLDFTSLDKFLAALKQASVQVLASGQNDYVYYAICRVKPDLFVFVDGDRPGKENFAYLIQVNDSNQKELKSGEKRITFAEDPDGLDGKAVPLLLGDVYHPGTGYSGPIAVLAKFGEIKGDKLDPLKTVDWR